MLDSSNVRFRNPTLDRVWLWTIAACTVLAACFWLVLQIQDNGVAVTLALVSGAVLYGAFRS